MKSAILGGYANHVRHLHLEAPVLGLYLAEGLFQNASNCGDGYSSASSPSYDS